MVGSTGLAVVADDLEAADHLADGEESKTLGQDNTASHDLGAVDVSNTLNDGGRLLDSL